MTVKELKQILETVPDDLQVVVDGISVSTGRCSFCFPEPKITEIRPDKNWIRVFYIPGIISFK